MDDVCLVFFRFRSALTKPSRNNNSQYSAHCGNLMGETHFHSCASDENWNVFNTVQKKWYMFKIIFGEFKNYIYLQVHLLSH